jgi:hypothetical protein
MREEEELSQQLPTNNIDYRELVRAIPGAWRKHLPEQAIIDRDEYYKIMRLFNQTFSSWGMRVIPHLFWRDMYYALQPNAPESAQRTAHWSPFLHNSMLSVALSFSDQPKVRARSNRELFAKAAKAQMDQECLKPEISTITGFSFLGSFHSGHGEHGLGFTYFGISVRMCRTCKSYFLDFVRIRNCNFFSGSQCRLFTMGALRSHHELRC